MTEYYLPLGSEVMEIDYGMLQEVVRRALVEAWGEGVVEQVEVAHFNPRMIDVTVYVSERRTGMDEQALRLSETLRRQGVPTAIAVRENGDREVGVW